MGRRKENQLKTMSIKHMFSLKKKLVLLIVFIIVTLSAFAGIVSYMGIDNITRNMYINRSRELSATAAGIVSPFVVRDIKDRVMDI